MKTSVPSPQPCRAMRVFVSSTFRDMQAEREELVKRVFPKLRRICEARAVTWTEVDLRWGVTDEERAEGRVLPICLTEIERCRPYFLGILGERYGWVPESLPDELLEREPWLGERTGDSVTEIEVRHGVLNDSALASHAFFYFRDPAFANGIPAEERPLFEELPQPEDVVRHGVEAAERLAIERRERLAAMKQRIRSSGVPVRDNYTDPGALGALVLRDLTEVIDRVFPLGPEPSPLDREAADHEAFAASRARVYVGRQDYFDRLDAHADGDGPPLIILGQPGAGKSALVANWVRHHTGEPAPPTSPEEHHNERPGGASPRLPAPILVHFIGASPQSTSLPSMLRRLVQELARRFEIAVDLPETMTALRAAFVNALHMVATRGPIVLVIDGLDRLDDREGALDLTWLPEDLPRNVRLIVTTLPGRPLQALERRSWSILDVEPLAIGERRTLIADYLAESRKTLSPARLDRIAKANQTANPLYMRILLEEIRIFGVHDRLDEWIGHYLAAPNAVDLYQRVLARYEVDYEVGRAGLVRDAMSLMWAARRGLSEVELRDLLGTSGEALPPAAWSPVYLAAEHSLLSRSGLISFAHDDLRQAVAARYLPTEASRQAAHQRLADYFARCDFGGRRVEEEPWQLAQAGAWNALSALLADLPFLDRAWAADPFDVRAHWTAVESASSWRMLQVYRPVLDEPAAYRPHLWTVAKLLEQTGHVAEALSLWSHLSEMYREAGDAGNLQAVLGNEALLLKLHGEFDRALRLHREEQRICHERGRLHDYYSSLNNQARILQVRGDLDGALAIYEECEQFYRATKDDHGLQIAMGNRGTILHIRGEIDEALKLFREKERLCREHGNQDGLCIALLNQGAILTLRGELDRALTLLEEQERLCRSLGNQDGLQASLGNQAVIFVRRSEYDAAMARLKEKVRICEALGNREELSVALGNQSHVLRAQGRHGEAMQVLKEQERACRDMGYQDGLRASLGRQAILLSEGGDLDGAMALHEEEARICRKLGHRDGLQMSLGSQALILKRRGDPDAAMALHKEQERICRELGNTSSLVISLGNQALLLQDAGDLDGAMALHLECERLHRELEDRNGLQTAPRSPLSDDLDVRQALLWARAAALYRRGDREAAVPLLLEAEQLCRGVRNQDGLQNALFLQAVIRLDRGDGDGALRQFREMETLCRALENRAGLERALGNQAEILVARGQYDAALPLLEEQEPLCRLLGRKAALERCLRARLAILMWRNDFAGALSLCQEHTTLCRELGDTPSLAASLFIQASLVGQAFGRPREGLSLLREARDLATTLQMTQVLDDIEALRAELEISGEAPAIDTMSIEELARYVPQGPADVLKIMGRIFTMTAEETDKFSAMQKALYAGRRGSRGST